MGKIYVNTKKRQGEKYVMMRGAEVRQSEQCTMIAVTIRKFLLAEVSGRKLAGVDVHELLVLNACQGAWL